MKSVSYTGSPRPMFTTRQGATGLRESSGPTGAPFCLFLENADQ